MKHVTVKTSYGKEYMGKQFGIINRYKKTGYKKSKQVVKTKKPTELDVISQITDEKVKSQALKSYSKGKRAENISGFATTGATTAATAAGTSASNQNLQSAASAMNQNVQGGISDASTSRDEDKEDNPLVN